MRLSRVFLLALGGLASFCKDTLRLSGESSSD